MGSDYYLDQWRFRIIKMYILLMDSSENVIQNLNFEKGFRIGIYYPREFTDIDAQKNGHVFIGQHSFCR